MGKLSSKFTTILALMTLVAAGPIQLAPVTIPLKEYFNGTDLQWYGPIQVGTPPQNFNVVFSPGGFDVLIPTTSCTTCAKAKRFDPKKSSTFVNTTGADGSGSFTILYGAGINTEPVQETETSPWSMTVDPANDTVSIGGISVPQTIIAPVVEESSLWAPDPFDGILGLSTGSGTLFQSLIDRGLPALFSFYLRHNNKPQSQLTLGGIDKTKYTGQITYTNILFPNLFEVNSTAVYVNGRTSSLLNTKMQPIFDTTIPYLGFNKDLTQAIYDRISIDIKPFPAVPGAYGIPCSKISSIHNAVIDITLTSQSGKPFNITIPSSELNLGPFRANPSICQTFINVVTTYDVPVLGAPLLKNYYTIWDSGHQRLGFAKPN